MLSDVVRLLQTAVPFTSEEVNSDCFQMATSQCLAHAWSSEAYFDCKRRKVQIKVSRHA